jgi:hypothetical protein
VAIASDDGRDDGNHVAGNAACPHRPHVQRADEPATRNEASVHEAASQETSTPASPLPFADRTQRLFGRHDVSSVQVHTCRCIRG